MKLAWKPLIVTLLFVVAVAQVKAAEADQYDPTKQYDVHSSSEVVQDPSVIVGSRVNSTQGSHQFSQGSTAQNNIVSPDNFSIPEAGASGSPISNPHSATNTSQITVSNSPSSNHSNWFQRATSSVSNATRQVGQRITHVATKVASAASYFITTAAENITFMARTVSSLAISTASNATRSVVYAITHPIETMKKHTWTILALALAPFGGAILMTPIGQAVFAGVMQLAIAGVVSAADLVLHGVCFITGSLISLSTGMTVTQGYQRAKQLLKKYTHHDIGSFTHDRDVVVTIVVIAATVYFSAVMLVAGVESVKTMMTESPSEIEFRLGTAANKTSEDCLHFAGQCDNPVGAGITLTSNVLFGVSPNLVDDLADEDVSLVTKVLKNSGDEAVMAADDVERAVVNAELDAEEVTSNAFKGTQEAKALIISDELKSKWYASTLVTEDTSIRYHWERHAMELKIPPEEYTKDALEFFKKNKATGVKVALKDGSPGLHFKGGPGGYFTPDGKIVTFWYTK